MKYPFGIAVKGIVILQIYYLIISMGFVTPPQPQMETEKTESSGTVGELQKDGYMCETCCKVFPKAHLLNQHIRKVHDEKRYACPLCDKVCKTQEAIKKHQAIHTGERPYICTHCGKSFADPSSRNAHEKYQHPKPGEEIVCKECGKQFSNPRTLKNHMVHHNSDTPYDGKRKQYPNEVKLEALKLLRELGPTEAARQLNLPFKLVTNWAASTKCNYQCSMCDKTFQLKCRLEEHERSMHNPNAFRGKGSRFSDEFKQEVVDYATKNSIKEACCYFSLGDSTVRGFVKILTNPINCTHCSRRCKSKSQLEKHLFEVHKVGDYRPDALKQESLPQFLENENIDRKKLTEPSARDVDPSKIVIYDPNQPREPRTKQKCKEIKKRIRVRKGTGLKPKRETKLESSVNAEIGVVKNENTVKMEVATEDIKQQNEDSDDDFARSEFKIMDDNIDDPPSVFMDDNDGGQEEDFNLDDVKQEYEDDVKEFKERVSDEEELEHVENMGDEDFETFMHILNKTNNETPSDNSLGNIKSERKSLDVTDEDKREEKQTGDEASLTSRDANVGHNDENGNPLVKSEGEVEVKADIVEKAQNGKRKLQEKNPEKKKRFRTQSVPDNMINFDVDLTRFEINEKDDNFLIHSKYMVDQNFMNIILSQRYKFKKKLYKCSECGIDIKAACDMKIHLTKHSSVKPYQCNLCSTSFKLAKGLARHLQKQHSEKGKEKRYKCEVCGSDYSEKSSLKAHQLKHLPGGQETKRPHQCATCGVSYACKSSLIRHMEVDHEGKNPVKHICPICGKEFRKTQNFKVHHRAHLLGREFRCDLCGNAFLQAGHLKTHKMFHCKNAESTTENKLMKKKFQCHQCEKVFTDNRNLKTHVKIIHEGKGNDFVCEVCSKVFSRRTSLAAHKLLHTGEFKVYNCDNCAATFKDKRILVRHQEKCFKNEENS